MALLCGNSAAQAAFSSLISHYVLGVSGSRKTTDPGGVGRVWVGLGVVTVGVLFISTKPECVTGVFCLLKKTNKRTLHPCRKSTEMQLLRMPF